MFLKSLEMIGFKSFGDKTVVNFHKGMTSIVGPNGCGKSNILDAIRWVLGEQSAKALRGGSMQDVICNGTDMRKSMGMAEVSLTFSDCETELGTEYHEVKITRRVFRDGQSEYELNKTPCRLKDIQRLFMDTGIGRTAYSIMEQGKIDALLSSKPEDRRSVFEEAAGITKFKSQKREAVRKLELTEANLIRVTDIIREVNRQIGSLQRQAAKARRYKEASEKLKALDTKLASHQFKGLESSVKESEEKVAAFQMELEGLQSTLEEKEGFLKQKRMDMENLEDQIRFQEQSKTRLDSETEQARQRIEFHQQRLGELEQAIEKNRIEVASSEEKIRFQQQQLNLFQEDLNKLEQEISDLNTQLQEQQNIWQEKKNSVIQHTKERENLDAEIIGNSKQTESNRDRIAHLESQQRGHILRVEKLNEDEKSWDEDHKEILEEIRAAQEKLKECEDESINADKYVEQREMHLEDIREKLKQKREEFAQIQNERAATLARKQALEQLIAQQEGYSSATKAILDEYKGKSVLGTLLDYLQVKSGYEKAIELCLGMACEAVLLENSSLADEFSNIYSQKGSVVMASMETLKKSSISISHRSEAAIHFVTPQSPVEGWVHQLLADYYIVDDIETAKRLRAEMPYGEIVTRNGEMISSAGWQLRGSSGEYIHQSVLSRNNELSKLETEASRLNQAFDNISKVVEEMRLKGEESEAQLSEARQAKQKAESECDSAKYGVEFHQKREDEWKEKLEGIKKEKNLLAEQDHSGIEEIKRLEEDIDKLQERNQQNTSRVETLAELLANLNREEDEQSQTVMDIRVRIAASEQRKDSLKKQESPMQQRLQELEEFLKSSVSEIEDYQKKIIESKQLIESSEQTITDSEGKMQEITQTIDQLSSQRKELQSELSVFENEMKAERRKTMETQSQCSKEEVALAERKMRRDALVERIQRAYQVQISETFSEEALQEEENWEEIETQVSELRDKIDRMGPVNLEAITEFEELEQRQKFLQDQEQDLIKSKDQLITAIKKIDETTRTMFAETFEKIQANFNQVFVDLFGGGRAALSLVDEQNPLESGIDIIAKPPGKQLQNISLLSGGEKTLTAVALLFAIYMVKPSPFCVLDEMDAPLDDSNIARFIHMLQKFVQQSQFIVITHNKRTIAAADVIYGITMEEQGISKVISVKLTRGEEDPLFDENSDGNFARRRGVEESTLTS